MNKQHKVTNEKRIYIRAISLARPVVLSPITTFESDTVHHLHFSNEIVHRR